MAKFRLISLLRSDLRPKRIRNLIFDFDAGILIGRADLFAPKIGPDK